MPKPRHCRNPECPNHTSPPRRGWRVRIGHCRTLAHGDVQRYRCRACGTTASDQSESIHYFAKRRLPIRSLIACLNDGISMREIGRRYRYSCAAIKNGVLRINRHAMTQKTVPLRSLNNDRGQEGASMMTSGMSWFLLEQLAAMRHEERLRERLREHPQERGACPAPLLTVPGRYRTPQARRNTTR